MAKASGKRGRTGGPKNAQSEVDEVRQLEAAVLAGAPPAGSSSVSAYDRAPAGTGPASADAPAPVDDAAAGGYGTARAFAELPLSAATQGGLAAARYTALTAIQRAAIPHALAGRDILGAAKTGSGKTLAFLVPLLEKLFCARWGRLDGLGALVLTPTRELAMQIFEELRRVGQQHAFSAGMLIGGKNVKQERDVVNGLNILVATPGRLLQHMDETPGFDAGGLQALVLDEADRILDMGFRATLDAILQNLPRERQTMLYSATQTKSVRDLARLSLRDPEYLAVHAEAGAPTPLKLQQAVMEVPLHQKLDALWSFIKTHLRCKVIVFMSTCKQVRYAHEALRRLRPGVPLRALHGKMKQMKRLAAFYDFCEAKAMVLFATDVAARGLDFPDVDWVVQADCPEDVASYIHRVGRTARFKSGGRALLMLDPSEAPGMAAALAAAAVPTKPLRMNPDRTQAIGPALQALCSKDAELKDMAQRAVTSYVRSVFLQPNRAVFDISALPLAQYASAMGLLAAPKLRFLKRGAGAAAAVPGSTAAAGHAPAAARQDSGSNSGAHAERGGSPGVGRSAPDDDTAAEAAAAADADMGTTDKSAGQQGSADSSNGEDDFLVVRRHDVLGAAAEAAAPAAAEPAQQQEAAKRKRKRLRIKPEAGAASNRVVFDQDGRARQPLELLAGDLDSGAAEPATAEERFRFAAQRMAAHDVRDRALDAEQRRQLRAMKKARKRAAANDAASVGGDAGFATLGGASRMSDSDAGDDSEGGEPDTPPRMALRPEAAHAGMVPPKQPAAAATLADREALALSLLAGGR